MPVPTFENKIITAPPSKFYRKYSVDDLNNIYKELLHSNNSFNQNLTAQIYFKNYIQDSLRFLREKAKEHEAKLRNQTQLSTAFNVRIILFYVYCFLKDNIIFKNKLLYKLFILFMNNT